MVTEIIIAVVFFLCGVSYGFHLTNGQLKRFIEKEKRWLVPWDAESIAFLNQLKKEQKQDRMKRPEKIVFDEYPMQVGMLPETYEPR